MEPIVRRFLEVACCPLHFPFPTPIDGFGGNDDRLFECEVYAQVMQVIVVMQVIDLSCLKDLTSLGRTLTEPMAAESGFFGAGTSFSGLFEEY